MTVYLYGMPGKVGGAATKIAHLLQLLHRQIHFKLILPTGHSKIPKETSAFLKKKGIVWCYRQDVPITKHDVVLAICERRFFSSGSALKLKELGYRIVWSNEMMWPFDGEKEAVESGIVDRVLWVSQFQARAFAEIYRTIPSLVTGNYIDPNDYCWKKRENEQLTLGRLSRADPAKYPANFPQFYEALEIDQARYRVMAWTNEVAKQYRFHHFGPAWDLLKPNKVSALDFLYSLDLFVYPLGHRVKESWGRAVVEAMLTGCPPIVPHGHQFHELMVHGESGFICDEFTQWKSCVQELAYNYRKRLKFSRTASDYARETHCRAEVHRELWMNALTFK